MSDLFVCIRKYQRGDRDRAADDNASQATPEPVAKPEPSSPKAPLTDADIKLGRLIWPQVVATGQVAVGTKNEWQHITFDQLISLPEECADGSGAAIKINGAILPADIASAAKSKSGPKELPEIRPRLYVSDDLVWHTITGHGEDFRRLPMMEWRLLVAIAATREEGILQGDLVRATGQDKRSVPRRTDFLSMKGYIAKRTTLVRGTKTSKLWLLDFAPELPAPSNPLRGMDMSKELLTRDMEPVPWFNQWVANRSQSGKEEIAYTALAQTIVAIIRAWGTVRIRDLKKKLGIEGLKWQMKTMSRYLRKMHDRGLLTYCAASFADNSFVFKDCVRLERDPSEDDWKYLLATGKKTSANPGYRVRGKKAKALQKKKKKWNGIGRPPKVAINRTRARILKKRERNPPRPIMSTWVPEKPITNTVVDFVKSGGDEGYTAAEITEAILHPSFETYFTALSKQISAHGVQPTRLADQNMKSELVRSQKKKLPAYVCTGDINIEHVDEANEESVIDPALTASLDTAQQSGTQPEVDQFGFAPIKPEDFAHGVASLTELCEMGPSKPIRPKRVYNRKSKAKTDEIEQNGPQPTETDKADEPKEAEKTKKASASASAAPAVRPARKRRAAAKRVSYVDEPQIFVGDSDTDAEKDTGGKQKEPSIAPSPEPEEPVLEQEPEPEPEPESEVEVEVERDRSKPGVYWGVPGSLNPNIRKKGRPKKSIVLIFKSDKFKDPNYLPGWAGYRAPPPTVPQLAPQPPKPVVHTDVNVQGAEPEPSPVLPSIEKGSEMTGFICEKCGGRWEGENGLKYHLEKGKNLCNPFYAARPDQLGRKKSIRHERDESSSPEVQYATDESSGVDSDVAESFSQRSSSLSVAGSPAPQARPQTVRPQLKPRKKKPKRSASRTVEFANPADPAIPRPVLKSRPILKKSRQRDGTGVVAPRGIEASEAAAQQAAASTPIEDPQAALVAAFAAAANRQEDENEPLPYLNQIRPKAPKLTKVTADSRSVDRPGDTLPNNSERPSDQPITSNGPATAGQVPEAMEVDSVYPEPPTTTNGLNGASHPYPAGTLESVTTEAPAAEYVGEVRSTTARKTVPGYSSVDYINTTPSLRLPTADKDEDLYNEDTLKLGRSKMVYRIQEIVKHLVHTSGGVFPMDRALHWAVLKVYKTTFGDPPFPNLASCTRVAMALVRERELARHALAFKANRGSIVWRQLHVVTLPHMKHDHPAVNVLKEKAKAAGTDMYIPPPYNPTENEKVQFRELEKPGLPRGKGRGRRDHKLAEGIATLTAPYYVSKGISGVRQQLRRMDDSDEADEERPTKRHKKDRGPDGAGTELKVRRRKRNLGDGEEGAPAPKRRGRRPRFLDEDGFIVEPSKLTLDEDAKNPGLSTLPHSFFAGFAPTTATGYSAPTKIQFLAPNTQLEEDEVPGPEPEVEAEVEYENAPSPPTESVHDDEDTTQPSVVPGTLVDTITVQAIEGKKGAWPSLSLKYFENNEFSFTMKGWLPGQNDILMENMPKTLEQMAFKLSSRCKTEQWKDADYGEFCTKLDGCQAWELSEQGSRFMSGSIAPNYLFMNISAPLNVSSMAPVNAQYLEENEWTLETIPYEMLDDDDDWDPSKPDQDLVIKRRPGRPKTDKPPPAPKRKYRRTAKDPNVREIKVQRELTAYPREPSEYFRVKGEECLGVDWKAEDTRIAAYVCVATLTGGINKAMDWGLMMRIFPESKLSNLRKFWSMIKKERDGFINTLTEKFQEEYLEAYENGDLPPFDFENPLEYDWPRLVKWTLALVVREGITLPPTRKQFDEELDILLVDQSDFDWREMYHHWQRSVFNKLQDSTSEPASTPLDVKRKTEDNDAIIARSWVRALCCTEQDQDTPYKIKEKFLTLVREGVRDEKGVSDLLEATIFDLEHRRIAIKQKANALQAGRPYRLNEHFARQLDRLSNENKFTVAADFKLKLDEAFRGGDAVEIPWRTEDGMVLAAFNLQAAGRVRIEPVKMLNIPFGFKPGFYESRKFPKSYYRFAIHIVPTDRYLYNEDIEVLHRATKPGNIPAATADGKLPMWCDFFGEPQRDRWFKMLGGVLFMSATRGAMTDEFAGMALKPCFEIFEIEMIRKWALEHELVREVSVAGGPTTPGEWWWLVVGMPMLEMRPAGGGPGRAGRRTQDQYASYGSRRRGNYRTVF